ncbi:DUF5340 domain-containing protein [Candidatus Synechococcus calcipolaris G9]|uniref:DUF5340 domain-containing protein n=1 Tax=Candidatus Synechococcus calcipolaris G9 TaxID=1497997 RepID=A0ABT6F3K8_9SYNE|nr:DUF5340 family protein [Candidatus Synechococcus calcipolaris]MDG2992399.1 DUF5340 domain-containing protein [Candidatus Synechococcus calcipolaris G9]
MRPSQSTELPISLPSHVHYELLLQLLEQVSLPSLDIRSSAYIQVQGVIVQLRKALSQQKQLEEEWQRKGGEIDYHWSLTQSPQLK